MDYARVSFGPRVYVRRFYIQQQYYSQQPWFNNGQQLNNANDYSNCMQYPRTNQFMGNPYVNVQQPIQNQQSDYQQMTQIRNVVPGRLVNGLDEIKPNEVPMDGSISFFPLRDNSMIFTKTWGSDGKIRTLKFIQVDMDKEIPPETLDYSKNILDRLDNIEKMLARKNYGNNNNNSSRKENQNEY